MLGLINAALQEASQQQQQQQQLSIIVPILNVDGVIHGWYRSPYSLTSIPQLLSLAPPFSPYRSSILSQGNLVMYYPVYNLTDTYTVPAVVAQEFPFYELDVIEMIFILYPRLIVEKLLRLIHLYIDNVDATISQVRFLFHI